MPPSSKKGKLLRGRFLKKRESIIAARAKERQLAGLKKGEENPVLLNSGEGSNRESWTDRQLAKMAGVGHDSVYKAGIIENGADEAFAELIFGYNCTQVLRTRIRAREGETQQNEQGGN